MTNPLEDPTTRPPGREVEHRLGVDEWQEALDALDEGKKVIFDMSEFEREHGIDDLRREVEQLEQSCLDDGLLASAFGRGNLRITKKGRELVKISAIVDEEVASALQDALRTPWLERRQALVDLVLLIRTKQGGKTQ
jgi:hypothetical protein